MSERKELMKISRVSFGYGGYQDAMFGLSVTLEGSGCGVGDFHGMWSISTEVGDYTKWTESDRDKEFAKTMRYVNQLLIDAKKEDVAQLKNVPVEVTFENNTLKSWRILTEVL
jgi:hypothetical protein